MGCDLIVISLVAPQFWCTNAFLIINYNRPKNITRINLLKSNIIKIKSVEINIIKIYIIGVISSNSISSKSISSKIIWSILFCSKLITYFHQIWLFAISRRICSKRTFAGGGWVAKLSKNMAKLSFSWS